MYTHRLVVDVPVYGSCVVFYDCNTERLPTEGTAKAYSSTARKVVDFDFGNVVESCITDRQLV
jgi:hypothetical protein